MSELTTVVDPPRTKRPVLATLVACLYFAIAPLAALLSIALFRGVVSVPVTRDPYLSTFNLFDLCLGLVLHGAQCAAALMLWRLRQAAFYLFVLVFLLGALNDWWHLLIKDFSGAIQRSSPFGSTIAVASVVAGSLVSIALCGYT